VEDVEGEEGDEVMG